MQLEGLVGGCRLRICCLTHNVKVIFDFHNVHFLLRASVTKNAVQVERFLHFLQIGGKCRNCVRIVGHIVVQSWGQIQRGNERVAKKPKRKYEPAI